MTYPPNPKHYKLRMPRDPQALAGEPVWGNGCERRKCLQPSEGVFQACEDGIAREFCPNHGPVVSR